MRRGVQFELRAADPEATMAFYGRALGWRFRRWSGERPYWMVYAHDDDVVDGSLVPIPAGVRPPGDLWIGTFEVPDLDAAVTRMVEGGGVVAVPAHVLGVRRLAYVKDPDGHVLGLSTVTQA